MSSVFADKRPLVLQEEKRRHEGTQPLQKRRRRFFRTSLDDQGGVFQAASALEQQATITKEASPVAGSPLSVLELRDVVISDLVQKGSALGASSRRGQATQPLPGSAQHASKIRATQEASFMSVPAARVSGSVELLEQVSQFEPNTRQRLLVFGLEQLSEEVFQPNKHLWREHERWLGVLLHLHPNNRARQPPPSAAAGPARASEPKAPSPKHEPSNTTSPFFLPPQDFSKESIARVNRERLKQCSFYGQKFSNFHCGSFVEVLSGEFGFDERLPPLALESSVTDEAVVQHIEAQRETLRARAFLVPLTVRLGRKSGWVYIRSRDKLKAEVELKGSSLQLFVGLWLTLERVWHVQHSTRHPQQPARKEVEQTLDLAKPPTPPISVHVVESRDQLSVIRREFFFVLRPIRHLWARYLCELSRYVASFSKRNKVWVDFEKQALCMSVVIPQTEDGPFC